jgi:hypothetical protein
MLSLDPTTWSVNEVGEWLKERGYEQYQQIFKDNFISGYELFDLSVEDLVTIGIPLLGHRKRLLKEIAALQSGNILENLSSYSNVTSSSDCSSLHSSSSYSVSDFATRSWSDIDFRDGALFFSFI